MVSQDVWVWGLLSKDAGAADRQWSRRIVWFRAFGRVHWGIADLLLMESRSRSKQGYLGPVCIVICFILVPQICRIRLSMLRNRENFSNWTVWRTLWDALHSGLLHGYLVQDEVGITTMKILREARFEVARSLFLMFWSIFDQWFALCSNQNRIRCEPSSPIWSMVWFVFESESHPLRTLVTDLINGFFSVLICEHWAFCLGCVSSLTLVCDWSAQLTVDLLFKRPLWPRVW
jgi:hypothetical protein